jgi:hypothetical protein
MKRAHRRWHAPAWLVVAGVSAIVLALVLSMRSSVPVNADLPPSPAESDAPAPRKAGS